MQSILEHQSPLKLRQILTVSTAYTRARVQCRLTNVRHISILRAAPAAATAGFCPWPSYHAKFIKGPPHTAGEYHPVDNAHMNYVLVIPIKP